MPAPAQKYASASRPPKWRPHRHGRAQHNIGLDDVAARTQERRRRRSPDLRRANALAQLAIRQRPARPGKFPSRTANHQSGSAVSLRTRTSALTGLVLSREGEGSVPEAAWTAPLRGQRSRRAQCWRWLPLASVCRSRLSRMRGIGAWVGY
jgi:hypothetical protein